MACGRPWAWLLLLVATAVPHEARAEPSSPAAASAAIDDGIESFHERRLANGMRVVVGVDRRAPLVGLHSATPWVTSSTRSTSPGWRA